MDVVTAKALEPLPLCIRSWCALIMKGRQPCAATTSHSLSFATSCWWLPPLLPLSAPRCATEGSELVVRWVALPFTSPRGSSTAGSLEDGIGALGWRHFLPSLP